MNRPEPAGSARLVGGPVALLQAAHAAPTVAVTALATWVAAAAGRSAGGCVLVALAVLTGQLSIGWLNDLVDRDRDRSAGRVDKPVVAGRVAPATLRVGVALAALACLPLSFASGWRAGLAHVVGVAGGWAYDLGLKRTLLSALPYALSFALLVAFLVLGLPGHPAPHGWLLAAGALLGVGAHFLNVVPDIGVDLAAGVRGLPQRMGAAWSRILGAGLLAGASACVVLGPSGAPPWWAVAGLLLAVGTALLAGLTGRRTASRLPFLLAILTAALTVALLLAQGGDLA